MKELERLRQQLDLLLDRVDKLNDPALLHVAQQVDRLIVEEMKKGLPGQEAPENAAPKRAATEGG